MSTRKRIGFLLGDPTGIGPEISAKLLAMPDIRELNLLVIGDPEILHEGTSVAQVSVDTPEFLPVLRTGERFIRGKVDPHAGEYVLQTIHQAVNAIRNGQIHALLYAPFNKQALKTAGMNHDDELHLFASLLHEAGPVSEINVCDSLWTSRVTSHVPLRAVADLISEERIVESAQLLHRSLVSAGVTQPRIAIAALNPHAGEGGLLGNEEKDVIAPTVRKMQVDGLNVFGPLSADTLFIAARRGDYDGVVTMYHDQGQIALKLMGFDRGITIAGGLSYPVATPAHGTAFDIVGQGKADVRPLYSALQLIIRMNT